MPDIGVFCSPASLRTETIETLEHLVICFFPEYRLLCFPDSEADSKDREPDAYSQNAILNAVPLPLRRICWRHSES